MEREKLILNSCKIIQREINKLNKMSCVIDLAGHTLTCFDDSIEAKKVERSVDGDNLDFTEQIVFEFTQNAK